MSPASLTAMFFAAKNCFAGVLTAAGPKNCWNTMTGLAGATASSSAKVGKRFSANCSGTQPPIELIHASAGTVFTRAAIAACTSAIEPALSSRVSCPGRWLNSTK